MCNKVLQNNTVVLSLVVSVLLVGIIGYTPNVYADNFVISDKDSCEELPATVIWTVGRCTLDSPLFLTNPDVLIINFGVTLDATTNGGIQTDGTEVLITNIGTIEISGDATLLVDTIVQNFGTITILNDDSSFTNKGSISGPGLIVNNGIFNNEDGGAVTVDGIIDNFGTMTNCDGCTISTTETFNHNNGASLTNFGTFGATFFIIDEVMNNQGSIAVDDGILTITSNGVLNNFIDVTIDQLGTVEILGTLDNKVDATVFNNGIINNQATGIFDNSGGLFLEQNGIFNNFGLLKNNFSGDLDDTNGFIELIADPDFPFVQFSIINNVGTFDNFDTIFNSCGEINGSLSNFSGIDPIDDCELTVVILSPLDGASFTNVTPITFLGFAPDRDAFGEIEDFAAALVWTSSGSGVIGNGITFVTTLSDTPPVPTIKATLEPGLFASIKINIGILDLDADGVSPTPGSDPFDCDDNDPTVFGGNDELADGKDNDCVDGVPLTEIDNDFDGFIEDEFDPFEDVHVDPNVIGGDDCNDSLDIIPDSDPPVTGFAQNPGLSEINDGIDNDCDGIIPFTETDDDGDGKAEYQGDCDDANPLRFFGNDEVPDGIDNDCDGFIPNNEIDNDGDGYIEFPIEFLNPPFHIDGNVVGGFDCNDIVPDGFPINPGAFEDLEDEIDNDCDGVVDLGDADADGDGSFTNVPPGPGFDCDDSDPNRFFGNPEIVDGIDNDCDILEELLVTEIDADGDGYIIGPFDDDVPITEWRDINSTPLGDGDCNDNNGLMFPLNPEINDGLDNDCDGNVPLTEIDNDLDGYTEDPFDPAAGDTHVDTTLVGGGDCDDDNNTVFPGAPELPDGILNDCLGMLPGDEIDNDGDGQTEIEGDCDDANDRRFTGNTEVPDGLDNDCDEITPVTETDDDGDFYIEDLTFEVGDFHVQPNVSENGGGDCNDSNPVIFPGAPELDNGIDDNCNVTIDEGLDFDFDGFTPINGGDCDDRATDTDPADGILDGFPIHPGAQELPNGVDDDCDGITDNLTDKFTTPTVQENLDDKTIRDFEKMMEKLSNENEKLEKKNESLDQKAIKEDEKVAKEEAKGKPEKADKHRAHADKVREEIASNESLIEINDMQILVIEMSLGTITVDYSQTVVITYDNLTDKVTHNILHDIEKNFKEIDKLNEKIIKENEKVAKAEAKEDLEEAEKHRAHADSKSDELEIIEDLNAILICAIDFTPDLLEDHMKGKGHHD